MINIEEDVIIAKVREVMKFQKSQLDHVLKCEKCMKNFMEITKCMFELAEKEAQQE